MMNSAIKKRNRDLLLVYFISFLDLFAVGLTVPLFSNHLRQLGATHFVVGLMTSLYSGLQVVSGPLIGSWSDLKARKNVLVTTLLICSISYIVLGFLTSIPLIVAVRIVLGIFKHTQTLCRATISDLLPSEARASAFGRAAAFSSIGFVLGPVLGGHLSEIEHGFRYVALLTGTIVLINAGCALQLGNIPVHRTPSTSLASSYQSLWEVEWSKMWHIFLLRFLLGLAVSTYFSQQALYLQEHFHLAQRHIGYTVSYFSLIGTLSSFMLHYIKRYFYKDDENCIRRLRHFFVLLLVSTVALNVVPRIEFYCVLLIPFAISTAVLRITSIELTLRQAGQHHKGSLSGASNSVMSIARFVAPVAIGLAADVLHTESGMGFSVLPAAMAALLTFVVGRKFKEKTS